MITKVYSASSINNYQAKMSQQKPLSFSGITRIVCEDTKKSPEFLTRCAHVCSTLGSEGVKLIKSACSSQNDVAKFTIECEDAFDARVIARAKVFADNNGWKTEAGKISQ